MLQQRSQVLSVAMHQTFVQVALAREVSMEFGGTTTPTSFLVHSDPGQNLGQNEHATFISECVSV